jgi:hypothetical protein
MSMLEIATGVFFGNCLTAALLFSLRALNKPDEEIRKTAILGFLAVMAIAGGGLLAYWPA